MTKLNKYLKYIYCFRNSCQETARDWIYLLERNLLTVDITPSTGTFSRYTLYCCLFHVLWDMLDLYCGSKTEKRSVQCTLKLVVKIISWSCVSITQQPFFCLLIEKAALIKILLEHYHLKLHGFQIRPVNARK